MSAAAGLPGGWAGTAALLRETGRLARRHAALLGLCWIALTAAATGLDQTTLRHEETAGALTVASVAAQAVATRAMMASGGDAVSQVSLRLVAMLVSGVVTGIAVAVGLVLLVLPGVVLCARWLLVPPLLIGEGLGIRDALRASWRRTRARARPIALAVAVVYLPFLVSEVLRRTGQGLARETAIHALGHASQVAAFALAVAACRLLAGDGARLRAVFA